MKRTTGAIRLSRWVVPRALYLVLGWASSAGAQSAVATFPDEAPQVEATSHTEMTAAVVPAAKGAMPDVPEEAAPSASGAQTVAPSSAQGGSEVVTGEARLSPQQASLPDAPMPERLPYMPGLAPEGYHLETSPRTGLIVGGAALWAVPYLVGLKAADEQPLLVVPVLGPLLSMESCSRNPDSNYSSSADQCDYEGLLINALLLVDAMLQTGGAAMVAVGFAVPKKEFVRDDSVGLLVMPSSVAGGGPGMTVSGWF
jgi:hypothetical protein